MRVKQIVKWLLPAALLFLAAGLLCVYHIQKFSAPFLYNNASHLPPCKAALVLGTSPRLASGTENLYFTYRMNAAENLYRSGKVRVLILSGDNRMADYNEPLNMKRALIKRGLPDSCLVLDYAGLRTFDSMVRCRQIFGQDSIIVVSQEFHNSRAVFIGRKTGMTAFGLNAQKVTTQKALKMKVREFFSRIKCVLDQYVLHPRPRHLGQKIKIK